MNQPTHVECACGKRLRVREELVGKKVKCPACGAITAAPAPLAKAEAMRVDTAPPAKAFPFWFFKWGDWSDVKKKRAFFVLTENDFWTAPLEDKAAKQAKEALLAGTHPGEALGAR